MKNIKKTLQFTYEILKKILIAIFTLIIKLYQLIVSPFFPPSCRFTPTCSAYGLQAIKKHGPFKGGWLTLKRILSCHPWGKSGHDPVP
ncbi:MAG: membrane protein insertion efficiency factor YidD [Bacteroidales bacterium]|nr:membrane protein insertion efficiency factor YidD [Bacteroidales bacterium]